MTARARYAAVTAFLLSGTVPLGWIVSRRYGPRAGWRFTAGMGGCLLAQQGLVGLALWRNNARNDPRVRHAISLVDAFTLSRGGSAALLVGLLTSGIRDRRGRAGWLGWTALLYGAIVSDWLDGPIARRLGTSEVGAMFDIEADSWLTLSSSVLAVASGGLPAPVVAPPLMRYLRLATLRPFVPYRALVSGDPLWTRHVGMAQMMLFIAALAPFGGRVTRVLVQLAAPPVVIGQLGTLAILSWRKANAALRVRRESC
ncbi:MAG TPA: CDP-alcohol phosphatidyltransferase family protein [Candidatus Dormibacteraeota bacterium]|nr:CDP-alcohol phosphatidyltransferase family protein [Candidatus Dormibacteraeota bacterium]